MKTSTEARILIWGSNKEVFVRLELELRAPGARVETHSYGWYPWNRDAFLAMASRFDLIVLPLSLPELSSIKMASVIHLHELETRTLLLTGGKVRFAFPLFDFASNCLFPETFTDAVTKPVERISDKTRVLTEARKVVEDNCCFGKSFGWDNELAVTINELARGRPKEPNRQKLAFGLSPFAFD